MARRLRRSAKDSRPSTVRVKAANATGLTILLVEQNVKEALAIVDTVMVLVNGTVRLVATPEEIRTKHDLHKLFLG